MDISCRWLKDYVDFRWTPEELAERLTMSGTEVERLSWWSAGLEDVLVGQVLACDPHPKVDSWWVCRVRVGERTVQVVCGASNIAPGQKVPVALPGVMLPNGERIEVTHRGGVESEGMVCSEMELGLSRQAGGVMVLDGDPSPGQSLASALSFDDWILSAEITPNRPDCMSMVGIAREVAALAALQFRYPLMDFDELEKDVTDFASVEIEDPLGCPRYTARVIRGVRIGPSPLWLRRRLMAVGLRPINNVVDVTNYVLFELGHPLHAFDYNHLRGHRIVVRRGREGERLFTLDGEERILDEKALLICDGERAIALAGIMGGQDTEVSEDTETVLLESAYFDPLTIRQGSQQFRLSTESSLRFERGADPNGLIPALDRATQMIQELAGGRVAKGLIDVYPKPMKPVQVVFRPHRANSILGSKLTWDEMKEFLTHLGFGVDDERSVVSVPTFRPDVTREIDIIEEIARLHGYDRIEATLRSPGVAPESSKENRLAVKIREILSGQGFQEVITASLMDPSVLSKIGYSGGFQELTNPLSQDLSVLRPTLLPNLLQVIQRNLHQKMENIRVYELGKVFLRQDEAPPEEVVRVAGALMESRAPSHWSTKPEKVDLFDLKGVIETLTDSFSGVVFQPLDAHPYAPGESVAVLMEERQLGMLGRLSSEVAQTFDFRQDVFLFDLDFSLLSRVCSRERKYQAPPRYPAAKRDVALEVGEEIPSAEVERLIWQAGSPLVVAVQLFDLYRGDQLGTGKKSLAYSISFQSSERTLTDEEVDECQSRIIDQLSQELWIVLRA